MSEIRQPHSTTGRLDSWKEIAAFFGRDERTVKRWEKERALPVHRLPGGAGARVFAYADELSRWMRAADDTEEEANSPAPIPATVPAAPVARKRANWGWIAVFLIVVAATSAVFLVRRPTGASLQKQVETASKQPINPEDRKGKISIAVYAAAIPLAFAQAWIAAACYVVVAIVWLSLTGALKEDSPNRCVSERLQAPEPRWGDIKYPPPYLTSY